VNSLETCSRSDDLDLNLAVMSTASSPSQAIKHDTIKGAARLIVPERALLHAEKHRTQIKIIFERYDIQKSDLATYAGFDKACIQNGLGFLEQIHVFTESTILATSPLLMELGKILSPFSSILFTGTSSFLLPVYKNDGTIWDWDDFVFETASKYINHTIMNDKEDESQKVSGAGENVGKEDSKGSKDKGKGRDRDNDENPGDPSRDGDHGSGHPDGDEGPDPEGETKEMTDSPRIKFGVVSKIYANGNHSQPFQEMSTLGTLTKRVCSRH